MDAAMGVWRVRASGDDDDDDRTGHDRHGPPARPDRRAAARVADYRTRLTELAGRPDIRTGDLIKIAGEVSRVLSEIEAADA